MAGIPTRVLGVDPGLVGTGWALLESRPIAPNDTPENLQKNRRTEVTVIQ